MVAITNSEPDAGRAQCDNPNYTRGERIADGTIHMLGITGSIVAFGFLFTFPDRLEQHLVPALIIYAVCSVALFCCSAMYHMAPWPERRPMLRRIDHSAIIFKIEGNYTHHLLLLDTSFGYTLITVVAIASDI